MNSGTTTQDILSKAEMSLPDLVIEYLTMSKDREQYFDHLPGAFFNPNVPQEYLVATVENLLENSGICPEGGRRFIDWLPTVWADRINFSGMTVRSVTVRLVVTVDEPFEGYYEDGCLGEDISTLVERHLTGHNHVSVCFSDSSVEEITKEEL